MQEFAGIVHRHYVKSETRTNIRQQLTHIVKCENGFRNVDLATELWAKPICSEAHYIMAHYYMFVRLEMLLHINFLSSFQIGRKNHVGIQCQPRPKQVTIHRGEETNPAQHTLKTKTRLEC